MQTIYFPFSFILCITLGKSFKCPFHFLPSNFISLIPPIYDHLRFQHSKYLLSLFLSISLSVSFTIYSIVTVYWVLQILEKSQKKDYMFIRSSIPTPKTTWSKSLFCYFLFSDLTILHVGTDIHKILVKFKENLNDVFIRK